MGWASGPSSPLAATSLRRGAPGASIQPLPVFTARRSSPSRRTCASRTRESFWNARERARSQRSERHNSVRLVELDRDEETARAALRQRHPEGPVAAVLRHLRLDAQVAIAIEALSRAGVHELPLER